MSRGPIAVFPRHVYIAAQEHGPTKPGYQYESVIQERGLNVIATRIEKLKFLTEEMHIALCLATHAPDAFSARTLARHILIRAENFIAHARGLRRPLNVAGYDTRAFHDTKEAYAAAFNEYFQLSRDRLGAHVQDFDFGRRIELWNDIEIIKIGFFVEGARELYSGLAAINLPGYAPYADMPELADVSFNEMLREFQTSNDNRHWVEIGTDPLAMTRDNTSAIFNMTPVHQRAGQLALIRRWINSQSCLLEKAVKHPGASRILKARILTDIVSFCDCLVTRSVPTGAPQEMDGLDRLITANGQSAAPISDFVAVSNFDLELQPLRAIRDKAGAHLEIDDARTLYSLVADLDGFDLKKAQAFYGLLEDVFTKECRTILYLRTYAADGQRLYGVTAVARPSIPFSGNASDAPPVPAPPPPINDEEAYRKNLTQWLDGDELQKGDARQFFWIAFRASDAVEQINESETCVAGTRASTHDFRKAHLFIASSLRAAVLESDFGGILDLILTCGRGSPYPLAELLARYGQATSDYRQQWLICHALGEIASSPHASVAGFLEARTKADQWSLRLQATIALFKIVVVSEGLYRVNNKGKTRADYSASAGSLTASMAPPELLICLLAFASALSGSKIGPLSQPFADDYARLQANIETLCVADWKDNAGLVKAKTLKQLIQTHDYVGVCVLLAIDHQDDARKQLREALIDACCSGSITTAAHDQASRHLAMCFLMRKDHGIALQIARGIATRNPDLMVAHVLVAQILADKPGSEDEAIQKITDLRRLYKLSANDEATLAAAEQQITRRKASS
jgi:hypothetical protein